LRLLIAKEIELRRKYDIRWRLTGVAPPARGMGLRTQMVLIPIALLNGHWPAQVGNVVHPETFASGSSARKADVLFETSSLEALTGQPAIEHLKAALEGGAHAISLTRDQSFMGTGNLPRWRKKRTGNSCLNLR